MNRFLLSFVIALVCLLATSSVEAQRLARRSQAATVAAEPQDYYQAIQGAVREIENVAKWWRRGQSIEGLYQKIVVNTTDGPISIVISGAAPWDGTSPKNPYMGATSQTHVALVPPIGRVYVLPPYRLSPLIDVIQQSGRTVFFTRNHGFQEYDLASRKFIRLTPPQKLIGIMKYTRQGYVGGKIGQHYLLFNQEHLDSRLADCYCSGFVALTQVDLEHNQITHVCYEGPNTGRLKSYRVTETGFALTCSDPEDERYEVVVEWLGDRFATNEPTLAAN